MTDIDTVKDFLRSPGKIDHADLINALELMNLSLDGLKLFLQPYQFPEFFALFGTYEDAVTSAACKVLNKLLQPMSYVDINSSGLQEYLILGLQHEFPEVRILTLNQIEKCQYSEEAIQDLVKSPLFPVMLECLGSDDIPTSTRILEILVKIITASSYSLQAFFDPESIAVLDKLSKGDGVVKFRVFDLIARISLSSPEAFQLCESSGSLEAITSELKSDDLLIKLNAIETLSKIIQSQIGYSFFEKAGILQFLIDILSKDDDLDITLVLVKCAVLKFFGKLCEVEEIEFSEVEGKFKILRQIDAHLLSDNMDLKITSIHIIGVIGHKERGLKLLYSSASPNLLGDFMDLYHSSSSDVKLACLQTISCLLGVSERPTQELSDISEQIYRQMGGNPTPIMSLVSNVKHGIEELRMCSFAILQKVALHPWGKTEMTNSHEFIDYIIDRSTESTYKGKEWKFAIIQTLYESPDAETLIAPNILEKFRQYLHEGPFYVKSKTAVALGNA
ncbi:13141_t:CDS:10 [Dentiscutata erythropus]|uniref:13141_t:CDS:1 n=1 Tax=Dentiscutata erythropus TaxID=1348616 RepID=A0A9N9D0G1_9GLOM|nr:13141_t:CDS:10 [Dentiscutata erythropus]